MMRLGLTWSNNDFETQLFGSVASALATLKSWGVRSLEFPQEGAFDLGRKRMIALAQDAGFIATLHAPSSGPFDVLAFDGPSSAQAHPAWEAFLDDANWLSARQGDDLVLATHGSMFLSTGDGLRELSRRATTGLLQWLVARSEEKGYGLRFGFENRPHIPGYTITGDSHAETLAIVQDVEALSSRAPKHLGTTWDMGHSSVNAYNDTEPLLPPDGFVQRVTHVHLHDTIAGDDHFPLLHNGYPYAAFIQRLAAVGYAGAINLELSPGRLGPDLNTARRALEASIERAKQELVKSAARG